VDSLRKKQGNVKKKRTGAKAPVRLAMILFSADRFSALGKSEYKNDGNGEGKNDDAQPHRIWEVSSGESILSGGYVF